jgi:hypothetical protein
VTHQATFGTLSDGDVVGVTFAFSGDDGDDGAGSGTVTQINAGAGFSFSAITTTGTIAVDGVLEDLDALGAPGSDGQFIVATGAGVFAYESGATAFTSIKQDASDTATGVSELATTAETITGTDTARVITPAGLHGALAGLTDATITASDTIIFADVGSSNALKEDTVQGILDLAGGGGLVFIGSTTASNSADITVTGLDSTYKVLKIIGSDLISVTDDVEPWFRIGDSSGVDSGTDDYQWNCQVRQGVSTVQASGTSAGGKDDVVRLMGTGSGQQAPGTDSGLTFVLYLSQSGSSTLKSIFTWTSGLINNNGDPSSGRGFGWRDDKITVDRVNFQYQSGNITSGKIAVYGIVDS